MKQHLQIIFISISIVLSITACSYRDETQSVKSDISSLPFVSSLSQYTMRKEKVSRVIDGDTIQLKNGETVRYLDINTPETVHPSKPIECYGRNSSDHNKKLVNGKTIYLFTGINSRDKYGRTLAYVYTENSFVNGELVAEGFAEARSYGQPGILFRELKELHNMAKSKTKGLWGKCKY